MTKLISYNNVSYSIRLIKSVLSFLKDDSDNLDEILIDRWRQALNCHSVLVHNNQVLFLNEIEDIEIVL
jgi:hypothetical protein